MHARSVSSIARPPQPAVAVAMRSDREGAVRFPLNAMVNVVNVAVSDSPCIPLVGVSHKQLDELAQELARRPDDAFLKALVEGRFHATPLAGTGLVDDLVARALPGLLPGVSDSVVETWRTILVTALQLPPGEWEVACLPLRHLLWTSGETASPLLGELRDALYRPYDMPREAWRDHLAEQRVLRPAAHARDIALDIQKMRLKGCARRQHCDRVEQRLRELASGASEETIDKGMKAVRQLERRDRGLLDPRWGLPAVFEAARGRSLAAAERPAEIVEVFARLNGMERPAATTSMPAVRRDRPPVDAASSRARARRVLAIAHDVRPDPQTLGGPVGRYDTWRNALASLLYVPGGLEGLRTVGADFAFAAEQAHRLHAGVSRPASRIAEATQGFVRQEGWMRRENLRVDAADGVGADVRTFLEGRAPPGTALAPAGQSRTEWRTVPGLVLQRREQVNRFLERQAVRGSGDGDAARVYASRITAPDAAEVPNKPTATVASSTDPSWTPRARAGALTDEGPRWAPPRMQAGVVAGASAAMAPALPPAIALTAAAQPSDEELAHLGQPLLLSAEAVGKRDVARFMLDAFAEDMASLDGAQQEAYLGAYREKTASVRALNSRMETTLKAFEARQQSLFTTLLENTFGQRLDPVTTYIHTRVLAVPERRNIEDMGRDIVRLVVGSPGTEAPGRRRRARALREGEPVVSWQSQTLWDAVKSNYAFNRGDGSWSASSFLSSSADPLADRFPGRREFKPDVDRFVMAVRGFDLAGSLRQAMAAWLKEPGFIADIRKAMRDEFAFDALDALREGECSGVDADLYRLLSEAIEHDRVKPERIRAIPLQLRIDGFGSEPGLLPAVVLEVTGVPGIFLYFPQRPGGALRFYPDARTAHADLVRQFVQGDAASDTWLARQLPVGKSAAFLAAQEIQVRPQGLNWLAKPLYDLFNPRQGERPEHFQIKDARDLAMPFERARMAAFTKRWSDMASRSATTTGEQDFAAFAQGFNEFVNEFSRWMAVAGLPGNAGKIVAAVFAGVAVKDLVSGLIELRTTDGSSLAEALENILTMAAFAGMHGGVGRLQQQKVATLAASTDFPLLATKADGTRELFRPDWDAYAASGSLPPSTALTDGDGLIASGTKQFARLEKDGIVRLLEVELVEASEGRRFRVVTDNAALRALHVVYDRAAGRWLPSFEDIAGLSDAALMGRMLSSSGLSTDDAGRVLDIARVDRPLLESLWDDTTMTPPWLAEAVGRVRAYTELKGLENALKAGDGIAPPVADDVLAKALAAVTRREVKIYEDGRVVEWTKPAGAQGRPIELSRLGGNHFVPRDSVPPNQAVPGAFSMVDALVSADPSVGRDPTVLVPDNDGRRGVLRGELLDYLQKKGRQELYDYLLARRGLVNRDADWDSGDFVASMPADPVVVALRETYPELTDFVARELARQPDIRGRMRVEENDPDIDLLVERHRLHAQVQRALEPLHFGQVNPESEALALSLWTQLPEWPRGVRVDVLEGAVRGGRMRKTDTLLGSYGDARANVEAGTVVRILRTADGRYAGIGGEGGSRDEVLDELRGDQLALAILHAMTDAQRRRLGIDIFRPEALRQRGREMARVRTVEELREWLDPEAAKVRCKRAPGDTCGTSVKSLLGGEGHWMPSEKEVVALRDDILRAGARGTVLPHNMVRDLLVSMHFRQPADFVLFRSSLAAILRRGTPHRGLPDYAVRQLAERERRNVAMQVDNEPLNHALAKFGYQPIRESYERSSIKSSNKRYDPAVVGPAKAARTHARASLAAWKIRDMRLHNDHAAPGGGWAGNPWGTMERVKVAGVGNCGELASAVADLISLKGYRAEPWQLMEGDHVFTVIGEPPALNVAAPSLGQPNGFTGDAWKALWVADAWLGIYCKASEYPVLANFKLSIWEGEGKLVQVRDPADPGRAIHIRPDARYRKAFFGRMSRMGQGGLVRLARQRWHDVLRQARIPDAPAAVYVPASDQALTRQSTSAEQNTDLSRSRSNQAALDSGPSLEDIDGIVNRYAMAHGGTLPEVGDIEAELRQIEAPQAAVDWDDDWEAWDWLNDV